MNEWRSFQVQTEPPHCCWCVLVCQNKIKWVNGLVNPPSFVRLSVRPAAFPAADRWKCLQLGCVRFTAGWPRPSGTPGNSPPPQSPSNPPQRLTDIGARWTRATAASFLAPPTVTVVVSLAAPLYYFSTVHLGYIGPPFCTFQSSQISWYKSRAGTWLTPQNCQTLSKCTKLFLYINIHIFRYDWWQKTEFKLFKRTI